MIKRLQKIMAALLVGVMCAAPCMQSALAGAGAGGGSGVGGGSNLSSGIVTAGDSTILKILPMWYGTDDKTNTQIMYDMEALEFRYVFDWFAMYMTLGDNPMYRSNDHEELIYCDGGWDVYSTKFNGGQKGSRYIENYIGKKGWTADAQYFYDVTKSATYYNGKTHTPAGIGADATPIGKTLNEKIGGALKDQANAKRYVQGYCDVLYCMFSEVENEWDFPKAFSEWIGGNVVSIGFELLQGVHPKGNKGDMYWLGTTAIARWCNNSNGLSLTKEGSYLRDVNNTKPTDPFKNVMRPFRGGKSQNGKSGFIETLYPTLNSGVVRDFGGWAFFDITEQAKEHKTKISLIAQDEFHLGTTKNEQMQYGENGLVYVRDRWTADPITYKEYMDGSDKLNKYVYEMEKEVSLNTPVNGTKYYPGYYGYRIVDAYNNKVLDLSDNKFKDNVKDDGWVVLQSGKQFTLKDNSSGIDIEAIVKNNPDTHMIQIELNAQYFSDKDAYKGLDKPGEMPQNKLTHLFKSLDDFTKGGLNQSIVSDAYVGERDGKGINFKRDYGNTITGLIRDMGIAAKAVLNRVPVAMKAIGDMQVKNPKSVMLVLNKAVWDTFNYINQDAQVYVSRADLGDKPVISSFSNNDMVAVKLMEENGFSKGAKGRDLRAGTTPLNKYLGFIRSGTMNKAMSAITDGFANGYPKDKGTGSYYYVETWDAENEKTTWRTTIRESNAMKGGVDTAINVNGSRYVTTPKNSYSEKITDGYVEYKQDDSGIEIVTQGEEDLYIYPTVEMEYDTEKGGTGKIDVVGDVKKPVKPFSYSTIKVNAPDVTVDSTAYASDTRAVELSKSYGNAPVFMKGGGLIASYGESALQAKTYVLDINNTSLKNAWGNSGYKANADHNELVANFDKMSMSGIITTPEGEYNPKEVEGKLTKGKTSTKNYVIRVEKGKIVSLGGLPQEVANKMRLSQSIESVLARGEGQNGWYNEDTDVFVVREFSTDFKIPSMTLTDKLPLDFGPESPIDKNDLYNNGVRATMNSVYKFVMNVNYGGKKYTKNVEFRTHREKDKTDFVIPNASVLDATF